MSSPMIYTSLTPSIPIPTTSVFTLLFQADPSTAYIGRFPGSYPAFIDANTATTLSRATLRSLSLSLGYGLTQSTTYPGLHKLAKGDTIMIFSPNSLAWPIILFGSVAAGLRCTLANSAYTPGELQYQWTDSGAKVVFVNPSLVRVVMEMFKTGLGLGDDEARRRVVVSGSEWLTGVQDEGGLISSPMIIIEKCVGFLGTNGPSHLSLIQLPSLLNQGTLRQEVPFNTKKEADETVYMCYSSGTTGKPKGVEVRPFKFLSFFLRSPPYEERRNRFALISPRSVLIRSLNEWSKRNKTPPTPFVFEFLVSEFYFPRYSIITLANLIKTQILNKCRLYTLYGSLSLSFACTLTCVSNHLTPVRRPTKIYALS